jgi:hypothetical protein
MDNTDYQVSNKRTKKNRLLFCGRLESLEARRFHFQRQSGCSAKRNHARREMNYWEIIADNLSKAGFDRVARLHRKRES